MILERFRDAASHHGDELAIIDGEEKITYARLLHRVVRVRNWLEARLDPAPGDVIAASLSNTWQFVACLLAVCGLDGVFMPCNPQWRARELRLLAARLGFRGVISEERFRQEWDQAGEVLPPQRLVTVEEAVSGCDAGAPLDAPVAGPRSEDEAAAYLATSGTLGSPRIVPRSHRNLQAVARNLAAALGIGVGRRFLSVVPFHHSNGFHNCLLMPLLSGATLVTLRHFAPALCAERIHRERVDTIIASPLIYELLADRAADPRLFSSLRLCISAGARMPAEAARRWQELSGVRVRQLYGTTETGVISVDRSAAEPPQGRAGVFVGAAIPGVEARILSPPEDGRCAGPAGEIAVRSPAVMSGYVREPERNQEIFHDGFFRTGDLGYLDPDGGLYLTGRLGRVINMSGVKVDPAEVEQAVETLPGVSGCHVDAVRSARENEVIRARIALRQGARIARTDVIEHCRRQLAEYKLPRVIEFVESLPLTVSGKMPAGWSADEFFR